MFLANIELANPSLFTVQNSYVGYQNITPDGVVFSKVMRYPVSGSPYAQKRSLIRLNFIDIAPTDLSNYEEAFRLATEEYVILSLNGLGMNLQLDAGHAINDAAWVTVAPGATFNVEITAGFVKSEVSGLMDGPYLHTFTLSFVTGDLVYSGGG
jgi:hypothetical protein